MKKLFLLLLILINFLYVFGGYILLKNGNMIIGDIQSLEQNVLKIISEGKVHVYSADNLSYLSYEEKITEFKKGLHLKNEIIINKKLNLYKVKDDFFYFKNDYDKLIIKKEFLSSFSIYNEESKENIINIKDTFIKFNKILLNSDNFEIILENGIIKIDLNDLNRFSSKNKNYVFYEEEFILFSNELIFKENGIVFDTFPHLKFKNINSLFLINKNSNKKNTSQVLKYEGFEEKNYGIYRINNDDDLFYTNSLIFRNNKIIGDNFEILNPSINSIEYIKVYDEINEFNNISNIYSDSDNIYIIDTFGNLYKYSYDGFLNDQILIESSYKPKRYIECFNGILITESSDYFYFINSKNMQILKKIRKSSKDIIATKINNNYYIGYFLEKYYEIYNENYSFIKRINLEDYFRNIYSYNEGYLILDYEGISFYNSENDLNWDFKINIDKNNIEIFKNKIILYTENKIYILNENGKIVKEIKFDSLVKNIFFNDKNIFVSLEDKKVYKISTEGSYELLFETEEDIIYINNNNNSYFWKEKNIYIKFDDQEFHNISISEGMKYNFVLDDYMIISSEKDIYILRVN